jgi:LacI family transcriptional regulator
MGIGPGTVAVTVSDDFFRGEEEREMGFRAAMRAMGSRAGCPVPARP